MFAIQNWELCAIPSPFPGDPCLHLKTSWRLVSVDGTGDISDLSGWQDSTGAGGNDAKGFGSIMGIGYSLTSEKRDQLMVSVGTGKARAWDLNQKKMREVPVHDPSAMYEENQGFFTSMIPDDVLPANKLSLYDSLELAEPVHFATIDTGSLVGAQVRLADDWGINEVQSHTYVAASGYDSEPLLFKAHRASGNVTQLPLKGTGGSVEALLVNPATGVLDVLLFTGDIYHHNATYTLHEYNKTSGSLSPGLATIGEDIQGYNCRAFDKATSTLSFGCNPVHLFKLGAHNATSLSPPVNISTIPPEIWGGSLSIGGVALWSP